MTEYATERARLLLGCYRRGDANDPDTYVAAITATLARYPEDVIKAVTHPASGLPVQKDFLPTVREVYLACEEADRPRCERLAREAKTAKNRAEREASECRNTPEQDAYIRDGFRELSARLGTGEYRPADKEDAA